MTQEATDPAVIAAISGGAAILGGLVGGGLGYRGITKQAKEERDLEHLQYRRETYLAFVDAAHKFMRGSGALAYDKDQWASFLPEYEHQLNAITLVGTPSVVKAAKRVQSTFRTMLQSIERKKGMSGQEARKAALRKHEKSIRRALEELQAAMRVDIGPD